MGNLDERPPRAERDKESPFDVLGDVSDAGKSMAELSVKIVGDVADMAVRGAGAVGKGIEHTRKGMSEVVGSLEGPDSREKRREHLEWRRKYLEELRKEMSEEFEVDGLMADFIRVEGMDEAEYGLWLMQVDILMEGIARKLGWTSEDLREGSDIEMLMNVEAEEYDMVGSRSRREGDEEAVSEAYKKWLLIGYYYDLWQMKTESAGKRF